MSRNSDNVKAWRKRTKRKLVDLFGGKCQSCGYNTCLAALNFHHRDDNKEFGLSLSNVRSWDKLVAEANKCDLLCANCHMEGHHPDVPQANLVKAAGC